MKKENLGLILSGLGSGAVNGLFGAGGGMVLIPLLGFLTETQGKGLFSSSIAVILPICLVSLLLTSLSGPIYWREALPYLPGSALGGLLAVHLGKRIPSRWLHRGLGIFILWGGIRYLC